MTKLDAGLMTSLPASDSGSAAVWGSKRINPRPQSCLCLTWSGYPSNDDDDDDSGSIDEANQDFCNTVFAAAKLSIPCGPETTTDGVGMWSTKPLPIFSTKSAR